VKHCLRFYTVGAAGVVVQLAALALLKSGFGLGVLPATAIAVEMAVLHNFFWHERI
jgi:putative flippase GtrA